MNRQMIAIGGVIVSLSGIIYGQAHSPVHRGPAFFWAHRAILKTVVPPACLLGIA